MKPTTTLSEESISPLLTEIVTLLNGNQNSILPTVALAVIKEWLARPKTVSDLSFTRSTGLLREFMTISGRTVKNPTLLSPLLEAIMEAYFRDAEEDEEDENSGVEALETGSWPELAGIQIFPDETTPKKGAKSRTGDLVETALKEAHVLVLYHFLLRKKRGCVNLKDEREVMELVLQYLSDITHR